MFKIKVGLKSFQVRSIIRCKHQIARIICYLKQSQTSFSAKRGNNPTFLATREDPTTKKETFQGRLFDPIDVGNKLRTTRLDGFSDKGGHPYAKERKGATGSSNKKEKVEALFKTISLPTLVKKVTTLRSPHIDKKSREQFEWKREKAEICFNLDFAAQVSFVLFVLTHSRFPGVEIEIGVESKTYFA